MKTIGSFLRNKAIIALSSRKILSIFVIPFLCILLFNSFALAQDYCLGFDGSSSYGYFPSDVQPSGSNFSAEAWVYLDGSGAGVMS